MIHRLAAVALLALTSFAQTRTSPTSEPPVACDQCEAWNAPQTPFRVFGNTYYVGTAGLSAVLVASEGGLILLDGALPQSAAQIDQNIRALGFRTQDVRLIVNSHAHFDHAGAMAELQHASGAAVAASPAGARALEQGRPVAEDPQAGSAAFPPVKSVRVLSDGDVLRVGTLAITAHFTPGHTPGSTTWTWQSCDGATCLTMVYADSLNPVSLPGFRFTGDGTHPSRVDSFRQSIARVAALPCDILLTVHPEFNDMKGKLARREQQPGTNPFIDAGACRAYAAMASRSLDRRIAEER
jgi:metallo-beta-lactamase class B